MTNITILKHDLQYVTRRHDPRPNSMEMSLLEKTPVAQLFKSFPTFYGTQKFITVSTRALHWSLS
jgi:hypothetical protein